MYARPPRRLPERHRRSPPNRPPALARPQPAAAGAPRPEPVPLRRERSEQSGPCDQRCTCARRARRCLQTELRPGLATLQSAAFGNSSIEWKKDAAAGGCANRIPSLTEASLGVGTPTIASPLGPPGHQGLTCCHLVPSL